MKTVVSSATRTVVIGPDEPFVIIGERINPTNRRRLAEELVAPRGRRDGSSSSGEAADRAASGREASEGNTAGRGR